MGLGFRIWSLPGPSRPEAGPSGPEAGASHPEAGPCRSTRPGTRTSRHKWTSPRKWTSRRQDFDGQIGAPRWPHAPKARELPPVFERVGGVRFSNPLPVENENFKRFKDLQCVREREIAVIRLEGVCVCEREREIVVVRLECV